MTNRIMWIHLQVTAEELCIRPAEAARLLAKHHGFKDKWTIADVIGFGAGTAELQARISGEGQGES